MYARLSRDDYADLLVHASKMTFNPVQAATLWAEAPVIDNDDRYVFAEQLANHMAANADS